MNFRALLHADTGAQFFKYVICGIATVAFYVGGVWLVTGTWDFPDLWVNSIFYALATVLGYGLNYFWSFKSNANHAASFTKYLAVAITGVGLNFLFVKFMTGSAGLSVTLAALIFAALWPAVSFVAQKFFVYRV